MPIKTVAFASDHAGFGLKEALKQEVEAQGYEVLDLGTHDETSVDYPDFGRALAEAIAEGRAERGIIVCGTGIGIAMAANRNPAVRAAVCHDVTSCRLARQHNDANVMALGARLTGSVVASDCVAAFLETAFEGGRHEPRVKKLS